MNQFGMILFGIIHGYFAAWLAVWMLFYPRSPKYFLGFRVPFTPGLLPSSRGQLEQAIAEAVSKQLLVPEVLEEAAIKQGLPKVIRSSLPANVEALANDENFQQTLSNACATIVKDYLRSNGFKSDLDTNALVPFGKTFGLGFDNILSGLWKQVEMAVDKVCSSDRFRSAMQGAMRRIAEDLKKETSSLSVKVEALAGKMLGSAVGALDVRAIVFDRLSSFSNEEIEVLVNTAAGKHLQSIKNVAAMLGAIFGIISVLLFG